MKYSQNEGKVSDLSICNAFVSECSLVLQTEVLEQHRLLCDPLPGDAPGFPSSVWPERRQLERSPRCPLLFPSPVSAFAIAS